jgi:Saccharopine dehydrogenase NADP binding domain
MKRVVVIGGSGFFGRLIVERLTAAGLQPIAASRSWGELRIDANDPESLRASLKQRDLVIDAAGPFQKRTPALIQAARTIGFDVIDLSDSPEYTSMIYEQQAPLLASGIRVLTACSSLSTVSALMLKASDNDQPRRLRVYLVPASRHTANAGAMSSFLSGVDGGTRTIQFPEPIGRRTGLTVKSVDSVTLPPLFPSLQITEFVVDSGFPGGTLLLRSKHVRKLIERYQTSVQKIAKRIGLERGILAYDVASALRRRQTVFTGENIYMLAAIPAIEAASTIVAGRFPHRGVVPPTEHVSLEAFRAAVQSEGIQTITV